jgi:hypothetical protein
MKRIFCALLLLLSLSFTTTAKAQVTLPSGSLIPIDFSNIGGVDITAYLGQACSIVKATWICDLAQVIGMVDGLNESGWQMLQSSLNGIIEGALTDAVQTAGDSLCVGAEFGGGCFSQFLQDAKVFLQTKPQQLFAYLQQQAQKYYLSNLIKKTSGPNMEAKSTPQYFANEALRVNPTTNGAYKIATIETNLSNKKSLEAQEILKSSMDIMSTPKEKLSGYRLFSAEAVRPDCASAPPPLCDPTNPTGGMIASYKNRARTAISTRELTQLMVELEADKIGSEIHQTNELVRKMNQMTQAQVFTTQQLYNIFDELNQDKKKKIKQLEAKIEGWMEEEYRSNRVSSGMFDTTKDIVLEMSDWTKFDNIMGRF